MKVTYTVFLLLLLVMSGCESDGRKRANRESLRFRTTDDAELFFKNLRQTEYDYQDLGAAKLNIYRHKKRNQAADYPHFVLALVHNWRYDEAYLVLEANELLGDVRPLVVAWTDSLQGQGGKYVLESNNKMEQLRFINQLYEGLQEGRQFWLPTDSTRQPFLFRPEDRKVFRTTVLDYYRLTGNIN